MSTAELSPTAAKRLLDIKSRHQWPCVYHFYRNPPVIARGEGVFLFDTAGKRYLDAYSGVGVMNAGHGNAEILAAVSEQLAKLQHTTTIYLTEPMLDLAEQLASVTPGNLNRSFFCASGSEANEAAMLLATLATGRREIVAFDRGLHGRTKAAMAATGLDMWRTDPWPAETFHRLPAPDHPDCLGAVETRLRQENVAACLIEPIQGNGGIHVSPAGFLAELARLCRRYGTLLIFDEVQTGFGRTGGWFAAETFGVVPDVMTVAKALGNGFPIAAAVTHDEIAARYTRPGASTFGGNPVSSAAALAALAYHRKHDLARRANTQGRWLKARLTESLGGHPSVRAIRGCGLMLGVELTNPGGEPPEVEMGRLLERLKDEGYLVGRTGVDRNVVTLMPPLIVGQAELRGLVDTLAWLIDDIM